MTESKSETYAFQSEVQQLLHILVYSLYKNKEVFLRELISNAADALNRVRHELLIHSELPDRERELRISIRTDRTRNLLIIEDTGVGMTREELVRNIGTIAHSGTVEYLSRIAGSEDQPEQKTLDLIGRFGVGFYSSFMVAKEIHLFTRSYGPENPAWLWKSKGETGYTIEETEMKERGTRIELFLKKECREYLEPSLLKRIILTHSKFVPFPITVDGEKLERVEAIWTQPKANLKEKDYSEFYKFLENTQEEPETYLHLASDAPVQFYALIYVPKTSFEISGLVKSDPGVDLYSRKVLIQKGNKDLLPEYLRFLRGIIDSEEIPLNISRETIQDNIRIDKIRKHLVKKVLEHLQEIKEKEGEKYKNFWKNFHKHMKEGIISDHAGRDKIATLLLFSSSKTGAGETVDLKTYVGRMAPGQTEIYFASGVDIPAIERNPALEIFKKKELEVLYLLDPLDEFALDHLHEFQGKYFKVVESADIAGAAQPGEADTEHLKKVASFITYLKTVFGDRIQDVRLSTRLVESPCMLAQPADGPSAHMEKIIKLIHQEYQFAKRILEINPGHALIRHMVSRHGRNPADPILKELAEQLLDNMMLREGVINDIETTIARIQRIMLETSQKSDAP